MTEKKTVGRIVGNIPSGACGMERCVPGRLTALLPVSLVVALTPYDYLVFGPAGQ